MNIITPITTFAESMQQKINLNKDKECHMMNPDGKGRSWENCDLIWLLYRLRQETLELEEAIRLGFHVDILDEAADVGNFAMMIHDIATQKIIDMQKKR